ncbi:MAG: uroporphyrinogen-III synthase [Pelistega sp.]|nr:uroporphyrinogen-III synthase [Pelistega sp.]
MAGYIVLTRPSAQNLSLAQLLTPYTSAQIIDLPALQINGVPWSSLSLEDQGHIQNHAQMDLIFAVSSNAVRHFSRLIKEAGLSLSARPYYAAVGVSTQQAWLQQGIIPAQVISPPNLQDNDSEALLQHLQSLGMTQFKQVLIVRAQDGRNWFTEQLRAQGSQVHRLSAYQRMPSEFTPEQICQVQQALDSQQTTWLISSIESAHHILRLVHSLNRLDSFAQHRFVLVHPRIGEAIQAFVQQATDSHLVIKPEQFSLSNTESAHLVANLLRS